MELKTLLWELNGPLLTLTLNRPEAANAMNDPVMNDLLTAAIECEEVFPVAKAMAIKLANGPTKAYGTVKALLNNSDENSLEAQLQAEINGIADNASTEDGREGISAFLEKRRPVYSGK